MDRWIAFIMALLIIVGGFFVIRNIGEIQQQIPEEAINLDCRVRGGVCVQNCAGDTINQPCEQGLVCCVQNNNLA